VNPAAAIPSSLFSLRGRVALVTGAGRGLGLSMACALAAHGASVWLNGRDAGILDAAVGQAGTAGLALQREEDFRDAERGC